MRYRHVTFTTEQPALGLCSSVCILDLIGHITDGQLTITSTRICRLQHIRMRGILWYVMRYVSKRVMDKIGIA